MEKGFLYDYLGGIEYPDAGSIYFGRIPLIPMGRWLMGVAVILFITGIYLSRRRQIFVFEMVRLGGKKSWWNTEFRDLFPAAAAGCLCYACCMKGLDFFGKYTGVQEKEEILMMLLWLVHMLTLASIFCLLDLAGFRHVTPAVLFMTEVSTYTVGFYWWDISKYMFGNWGMYLQSDRVEEVYGFSPAAVILLEGLMIAAAWKMGALLLERKDGFP